MYIIFKDKNSKKKSQSSRNQGYFSFFSFLLGDRRIRIRVQEAQKHVDPADPDSDPQHWRLVFVCYCSSLCSDPDISKKYKMGDISKGVANTLKPAKRCTKKLYATNTDWWADCRRQFVVRTNFQRLVFSSGRWSGSSLWGLFPTRLQRQYFSS